MGKTLIVLISSLLCSILVEANESPDIEKIYYKQCATCHGNNGDGKGRAGASLHPAPTDFTSLKGNSDPGIPQMKAAIRDGITGTSMVAYGRRLDEVAIDSMVEFIRHKFMGIQASPESLSPDGKRIYEEHCAVCHGDNGASAVWAKNGLNPPPRDFTSPASKQELSRDRMLTSVIHGRPGTAMMSFTSRLSTEEISAVVDYIRFNFIKVERALAPSVASTTDISVKNYPGGFIGDASRGKQFYQSNCFVCHGKAGKGDGPRAHFNRPRPRNFTTEAAKKELDRPRLFEAISKGKRGTVMPAWATVLTQQQIADVAEYVYQNFLHPQKKKH